MKKSEQRLFVAFMTVLVVCGSFLIWKQYNQRKADLLEQAHQLALREIEIDILFEQREKWLRRSSWLEQTQPKFSSRDQVDNDLLNDAQSAAPGVTIQGMKLLEPVETADYIQAGIQFTAHGQLRDVFSWLYELQRPDRFRVIGTLKVSPDKDDPSKVSCEIGLLRWYSPTPMVASNS